jgi:type I restriction enzyme S subunit
MSSLRFIEKLLDGVEVEWKSLGAISTLRRGRVMSKGYLAQNSGDYPVYSSQTANNGMIGKIDTFDFDGEFISWTTDGANAGTVFYRTGKFSITNVCGLIKINSEAINYKYLFYWLTIEAQKHVYSGMGNPKLMSHQVEKIPVPIPCPDNPEKSLEIQAEIVRILDAFTAMTAELTAELNLRKQQYNHYRDQLLSFEEGEVEWKMLGWIGDVRMCKRIMKNQTSDSGDIPFFKIGTFGKEPDAYISRELFENYKGKYNYPRVGEILISASGTIGRAVIFNGEEAYFQDSNIVWLENDESKVLNKYLFYFYQIASWNVSDGGVIKRLYNDNIKKTLIPIPFPNDPERSLAEQAKVVEILDKFDALSSSITEGLPREIELRQKQYEYYRDLLLSFPKANEEAVA